MMRSILFLIGAFLLGWFTVYGQEKRNLLENSLKGLDLADYKLTVEYPGYAERVFWEALSPKVRAMAIKKAEKSRQVKLGTSDPENGDLYCKCTY